MSKWVTDGQWKWEPRERIGCGGQEQSDSISKHGTSVRQEDCFPHVTVTKQASNKDLTE